MAWNRSKTNRKVKWLTFCYFHLLIKETQGHAKILRSTKNVKTERYCFFCKGVNFHGSFGFGEVSLTTNKFNFCKITPLSKPAQRRIQVLLEVLDFLHFIYIYSFLKMVYFYCFFIGCLCIFLYNFIKPITKCLYPLYIW